MDSSSQSSKYVNTTIMFKESKLNVHEVMTMVAGYCLRFGSSLKEREHLVELLKTCAGPSFKTLKISQHYFATTFDPPDDKIIYHYYCINCYCEIYRSSKKQFKTTTVLCGTCESEWKVDLRSDNVFISLDLRYQIELLLQDIHVRSSLIRKSESMHNALENDGITDIQDGELYKQMKQDTKLYLTFNGTTDGASLGDKTKRSIWPLALILNNLSPDNRFKYILMAGITVTKGEPSYKFINAYMQSLVDQFRNMTELGVSVQLNFQSPPSVFIPTLLCLSADSVARPLLQSRVKFNGYFGCSYCYQRGTYLNNAMRYPFGSENAELRTHESHVNDIEEYDRSQSLTRSKGVKGKSVFCSLENFDMVWGFPFDNMHTTLLGVTKYMWELWEKKSYVGLNAAKKMSMQKKLLGIKPPHEVHKLPHLLDDISNFKAKDWRAWLFYYSIPVCLNVIPTLYLNHYALLVKCIYILCKDEITPTELQTCEEGLIKFVGIFEALYGAESMRIQCSFVAPCR